MPGTTYAVYIYIYIYIDVLLTVHLSVIILVINQLEAQNLFYSMFISCLILIWFCGSMLPQHQINIRN